jgi:hypothetical protein
MRSSCVKEKFMEASGPLLTPPILVEKTAFSQSSLSRFGKESQTTPSFSWTFSLDFSSSCHLKFIVVPFVSEGFRL